VALNGLTWQNIVVIGIAGAIYVLPELLKKD